MREYSWTASCLRNWLWFTNIAAPLKVGVHCSNLGSVSYEIAGKAKTILLNGREVAGTSVPFSSRDPRPALLEGEKLHWSWRLAMGIVVLKNQPSGRCVTLYLDHCVVQDHNRKHRLDCADLNFEKLSESRTAEIEFTHNESQPSSSSLSHSNRAQTEPESGEPLAENHWAAVIVEEPIRRVFLYLERHGSISDLDLEAMLGSPRQARQFANRLDDYRSLVPFEVQIEATTNPKIYRKI